MICDFAQYYHVLSWRSLPVRLAATLAMGLPRSCRSFLHLEGLTAPEELQFQAAILDALHLIEWRLANCPGGRPPDSVLASLRGVSSESARDVQAFSTPEEFEAARASLRGGDVHGH